jgi:hypothetical protein
MQELIFRGILDHARKDWRTRDLYDQVPNDRPLRGIEIAEWLLRHPEIQDYVILDDDPDILSDQLPRFVRTDFKSGLTQELADKTLALLTKS